MRKVILLGSVAAMLFGLASCGRECVCKEKINGKLTEKVIVKNATYGDCESDYDFDEDYDYEYECK